MRLNWRKSAIVMSLAVLMGGGASGTMSEASPGSFAWDPGMSKKVWVYASDSQYHDYTDAGGDFSRYWDYTALNAGTPADTSWWGQQWSPLPTDSSKYKLKWVLNNVNNPDKWDPDLNFIGFQMSAYRGLNVIPVIGSTGSLYYKASVYLDAETSANDASSGPPNIHGVPQSSTAVVLGFAFNEAYEGGRNYPRFVEISPYVTTYGDFNSDPNIIFHGAGPDYEMYRIPVTHPLVQEAMMTPGDTRTFNIDIAQVARGLTWSGIQPDWSKAAVGSVYFGYESYGDALTTAEIWDFDFTSQ
ncbi:hypothetical protein [Paenibacillus sp. 598K]|uniref:hypothetical protein n=1 Tax=Paenibacillus sp. 598K TaxID=1117987 RepID=UPI000FFEF371|nr:hypothetical protein [Paenibacillus sp. 598K]